MPQPKTSYWFKRRRYGWGWFPVTWQAWALLAGSAMVILLSGIVLLNGTPRNTITPNSMLFLAITLMTLVALIIISYRHAPKPKWRWGTSPTDNPDQDF